MIVVDVRGQEQGKRTIMAGCPFTWVVNTKRLQTLLLRCWVRIVKVRGRMGWAGVLEGCEIEGILVAFVVCGGGVGGGDF